MKWPEESVCEGKQLKHSLDELRVGVIKPETTQQSINQLMLDKIYELSYTSDIYEIKCFLCGKLDSLYQLMTSWWPVDDQLMTSWWPVDDQLMTSLWSVDDQLMISWWPVDDQLMTSWRSDIHWILARNYEIGAMIEHNKNLIYVPGISWKRYS